MTWMPNAEARVLRSWHTGLCRDMLGVTMDRVLGSRAGSPHSCAWH